MGSLAVFTHSQYLERWMSCGCVHETSALSLITCQSREKDRRRVETCWVVVVVVVVVANDERQQPRATSGRVWNDGERDDDMLWQNGNVDYEQDDCRTELRRRYVISSKLHM